MERTRHHLLIHLCEHFQFTSGGKGVPRRHWHRFPSRIAETAEMAVSFLKAHGVRATFAVDAWVAERHPQVVARVASCGHEIAMTFKGEDNPADLRRMLEDASGKVVQGAVAAAGHDAAGNGKNLQAPGVAYVLAGDGFAASRAAGLQVLSVPTYGATGEWLRLLPGPVVDAYVRSWVGGPARVFGCSLWEFDPKVERLAVNTGFRGQRAYRNLDAFPERLGRLLAAGSFGAIRENLGLPELESECRAPPVQVPQAAVPADAQGVPVSVVVPCYNEESGLEYLANTIASVRDGFGRRHGLSFVLVDDGSTDGTWDKMQRLFGEDPGFRLVRHDRNRGIGAAILTGCRNARDEIIAVIDSDCSYDPARIEDMLAFLEPDVAIVTASPYHDQGGVEGVPEWRLFLSKGASFLYRAILRNKLATYTSCFRVFRKSAISDLHLTREGYIGVVEMLARLDFAGWRIVEYPIVLESRMLGHSKIRIPKVIAQHLKFMSEIVMWRIADRYPRGSLRATR